MEENMKRAYTVIQKYRYVLVWFIAYLVLLQVAYMTLRSNSAQIHDDGNNSSVLFLVYFLAMLVGGASSVVHAASMNFRSVVRWAINPALGLFIVMGAICAFNAKSLSALLAQLFGITLLFSLTTAISGLTCHKLYMQFKAASSSSGN